MFPIWMRVIFLSCPTKQDIVQEKVRGCNIQKDHLTLTLCCKHDMHKQVEPYDNLQFFFMW